MFHTFHVEFDSLERVSRMKTLASLAVVAAILAPTTASAEQVVFYKKQAIDVQKYEVPIDACLLLQAAFAQKVLTFSDDDITMVYCDVEPIDVDGALRPLTEDQCTLLTALVEEKIGVPKNAVVYSDCDPYEKAMDRRTRAWNKVKDHLETVPQSEKDYLRSLGGQPTPNDHRVLMFMPDFLGKSYGND